MPSSMQSDGSIRHGIHSSSSLGGPSGVRPSESRSAAFSSGPMASSSASVIWLDRCDADAGRLTDDRGSIGPMATKASAKLRDTLSELLAAVPTWQPGRALPRWPELGAVRAALEEARNTATWHPRQTGVAHVWDPVRRQLTASKKEAPPALVKLVNAAIRAIDTFHPETSLASGKAKGTEVSADMRDFLRSVLNIEKDADDATYGGLGNYQPVQAALTRTANDPRRFAAKDAGLIRSISRSPYYVLTPKGRRALARSAG